MKIWHQSMADFGRLETYGAAIKKHSSQVCEEDTEVAVKGMPPKNYIVGIAAQGDASIDDRMTTGDMLGSPYIYHMGFRRIIDHALEAERDGYDAFVIGSFSEPFLRELRATVSIPVVSVGEANFLLACSYGKLQAHIANVPEVARIVTDHVHEYRLTDRVAGVYAVGPEMDEHLMQQMWNEPGEIIERFTAIAHEAIRAGADVIIPVEGVLSELLYLNGVKRIGKAPVFDSFGMAWKYAELLVSLKKKMQLEVGREWEYRRPTERQLALFRQSIGAQI
ncbi:aspartate/glutamate racemase family protein [Caballeronia sp. LjRoot34]|uniref:aspartate/glutamate racemase family protein n=1 Tax=Caballeronia sp. LjRoot34 TaxID=3342325 RepID=UPI003ED01F3D